MAQSAPGLASFALLAWLLSENRRGAVLKGVADFFVLRDGPSALLRIRKSAGLSGRLALRSARSARLEGRGGQMR